MTRQSPRIRVRVRSPEDKKARDAYNKAIQEIAGLAFPVLGTWQDARRFGKELVDAMYLMRGTAAVSANVGDRYIRLHQDIQRLAKRIDAIRHGVPANHQFFRRELHKIEAALSNFAPPIGPSSQSKARFAVGDQEYSFETMPKGPAIVDKVRVVDAAIAIWTAYIADPPAARKSSLFSRVLAVACNQAGVKVPGRVVVAKQITTFNANGLIPGEPNAIRIWVKSTAQT